MNEIAKIVSEKFDEQISINYKQTNDPRSYHVSSKLIEKELGFKSEFTVQNAVEDLLNSFKNNLIPNAMTDNIYYNVKRMQEIKL